MSANVTIHHENIENVFVKASEFLQNWLKIYYNITQKTLLLLSGGSVMELYKPLAEFIKESNLDFRFLSIGQVDERFFGTINIQHSTFNKENINAYQIEKTGLWEACEKKKIPYYLISQDGTLNDSAERYNRILEKLFEECVYKIAVLGIGEDGHTAGLLPGYERDWNTVSLVAGYKNSGKFTQRISITPKAIKMLDQAIVVASGEKKREVIKHITYNIKHLTYNIKQKIHRDDLNEFPAIILQNIPQVDLFTDLIS